MKNPRRKLSWWLLIHQLPPEPLYLRAKIRKRLARIGAVALKKSVYVLPRRDECLEDLEWIAEEAISGGGEAHVCAAEFPDRRTDALLVSRFRSERDAEYRQLAREISAAAGGDPVERLARARRRYEEIRRVDFFGAAGSRPTTALLDRLERGGKAPRRKVKGGGMDRKDLIGRTWTTRRGVKVDRIASAWLVRRFLDSKARFRFVDPAEPPRKGELRFDMVGGDFTHEGDRCTFETLLAKTRIADSALEKVAEIVHDIDVKDGKYGRAETAGVQQLLSGLLLAHEEDESRLTRGFALFDELYGSFRGKTTGRRDTP